MDRRDGMRTADGEEEPIKVIRSHYREEEEDSIRNPMLRFVLKVCFLIVGVAVFLVALLAKQWVNGIMGLPYGFGSNLVMLVGVILTGVAFSIRPRSFAEAYGLLRKRCVGEL
ncbi:hypothetical protein CSQ85_03060 [Bifidobacterium rousetti]|uniref:hypothetical protein n=1 Tax=Bifidobacterium rousetti TaxID=2045439 RepID=UPI000D13FA35|nr:hypothetical protein [Bifidobacterium rousetti]KAA8819708.1 hypothetical protein CSQ85_03060 [Bifidobacterium rousetti]PST47617.1 hypothetical protein COO72_12075 [Bifidobacterium callitrichos]